MAGFVEGIDRGQCTLFPPSLEDYVAGDNPVRAVDMFVESILASNSVPLLLGPRYRLYP
jgi:hypothetical protein